MTSSQFQNKIAGQMGVNFVPFLRKDSDVNFLKISSKMGGDAYVQRRARNNKAVKKSRSKRKDKYQKVCEFFLL